MAIYVGNTLVADVGGGGVSLSTSTATRYLTDQLLLQEALKIYILALAVI